MTNKRKIRAKALASKTGVSYAGAINQMRKNEVKEPVGEILTEDEKRLWRKLNITKGVPSSEVLVPCDPGPYKLCGDPKLDFVLEEMSTGPSAYTGPYLVLSAIVSLQEHARQLAEEGHTLTKIRLHPATAEVYAGVGKGTPLVERWRNIKLLFGKYFPDIPVIGDTSVKPGWIQVHIVGEEPPLEYLDSSIFEYFEALEHLQAAQEAPEQEDALLLKLFKESEFSTTE